MRTLLRRLAIGVIAVFVALQLIPVGATRTNPPVLAEPPWDSPRTRELAVRACYDCHSNATRWPWYSRIAPVSWLVAEDVREGRREPNFSEFDRPQRHADDAAGMVRSGEMPLWFYPPLHSEARLSPQEKAELIRGLEATFGSGRGPRVPRVEDGPNEP